MTTTSGSGAESGSVPVLMYHSVSRRTSMAFEPFVVPPSLFRDHVGALRDAGYSTITAGELSARRRASRPALDKTVVLTFDDAFADFYEHALPILATARFAATLFVPTGYVGGTSRWLVAEGETRRPLLGWHDLEDVRGAGVECGSHSHSHPQLDLLRRRDVAREVALSKSLLEDRLHVQVETFAYPFGYCDRRVRELVERLGFSAGYAVGDLVSLPVDDPFAVPRLTITPDVAPEQLLAMLGRPRRRTDDLRSAGRTIASRLLRQARLKKRSNAPERAVRPPTEPRA